jgi:CBS domain-containing protein
MRVSEVMTRDVQVVRPGDTVQKAARMMDDLNVGAIPVCDGQKLVGMVTDRDITVRSTSAGKAPDQCQVDQVMSQDVRWVFDDDDVDKAQKIMSDSQIRRVAVIKRDDKSLVGIVAMGDLATKDQGKAAQALKDVSSPSQPER